MENLPRTKLELLAELQQAAAELEETLNGLKDEQISGPRDSGGWSIQDHLNHLAAWEQSAAMLLEGRSSAERLAAMQVDAATAQRASEDELNEIVRGRTRPRTVDETRQVLRAVHEQLVRAVNTLTDVDLGRDYSHYQPEEWGGGNGRPVVSWVVGNSSGHYREHLPWIRAIAGLANSL